MIQMWCIGVKKKVCELVKLLWVEWLDYVYFKEVFCYLWVELEVEVLGLLCCLLWVLIEEQVWVFYEVVWCMCCIVDFVLIKIFLYIGVCVFELVMMCFVDVDLDVCQIWVNLGKGSKDWVVLFLVFFKEMLVFYIGQR